MTKPGHTRPEQVLDEIIRIGAEDEDLASRRFFALLSAVLKDSDTRRTELLDDVLSERPGITPEHFAWLLFAGAQHLSDKYFDRLAFPNPDGHEREAQKRLQTLIDGRGLELAEIARSYNICTNVPQRYAGLQIITHLLYGGGRVHILDVGCSIGLGLMALNTEAVRRVRVTDDQLRRALFSRIDADLVGLDTFPPPISWLESCYFPQYLVERERAQTDYHLLKQRGSRFDFIQGDVMALSDKPDLHGRFDIVWTSNTCYEVEGELQDVENEIRTVLKDGGVWIYAYYRSGQPHSSPGLPITDGDADPYVICVYGENHWDEACEVLVAASDEVRALAPGRNYEEFCREYGL